MALPTEAGTALPEAATSFALARRRRRARVVVPMARDAAMLAGAGVVSALSGGMTSAPPGWAVVFGVLVLAVLVLRGSFRTRLRASVLDNVGEVVVAAAVAASALISLRVLVEDDAAAAAQTVRSFGFGMTYLLAGRLAYNIATYGPHRRGAPTLVVGAGTVGQGLARRMLERPEMGLHPVGFLDKDPRVLAPGLPPVLGDSHDLEAVVRAHDVEQAVIAFSTAPTDVVLRLIRRAHALGVEVTLVPRFFEHVHRGLAVEHLGGTTLLRVSEADPRGWQFEVKYALDRVVAAVALLALSPLLLVLALAVRLSSPGPILFRQPRMGLDGQVFDILKFRTMREGRPGQEQDAAWAAAVVGGQDPPAVEAGEDRRTRPGRLMRRLSLDELPQLVNIVRGEMSFIGPRPERFGYAQRFGEHVHRYGDRHRVKSGLTGWAQVQGLRGETSLEDRIEWDNFYVENWSPGLDLKILLLTPVAVLGGHGSG